MSDDKRYVVTYETYVYAPNDYMARKRSHAINDLINGDMNKAIDILRNSQNSEVTGIVEQPFGTIGNRKLDDISKPTEKKDSILPF